MDRRRDIEGLRGVAVLLVIAFHYQLPFAQGGFIGVDVFYVISGFLIASILQKRASEPLLAHGIAFLNRRLKRLGPAMFAMIAVTSVATWLVLLPDDLEAYWKSVREVMLIRSNHLFERELNTYFAADAKELPLLHTWSLSIEWQLYLLFPLPFLVALRTTSRRSLLAVMVILTATLAGYSAYLAETRPGSAYFMTSARAFEFLLGATAFLLKPYQSKRHAAALVAAALLAIVGMAVLLTQHSVFPGYNAAAVCLLAAGAIHLRSDSSFLNSAPLQRLGSRSYSLYLWHWPVLVMAQYVGGDVTSNPIVVGALLASVVALSEVTYRLVELPGIALRWRLPKTLSLLFFIPLALAAATFVAVERNDGFASRLGDGAAKVFGTLEATTRAHDSCNDMPANADLNNCVLGNTAGRSTGLLIGDSHAQHYWAFVDEVANLANIKVIGSTYGECLALKDVIATRHQVPYIGCIEANRRFYEMIGQGRFQYVFLAQRWIGYPDEQLRHLEETVGFIVASGAIPVIMMPIAEDGRNAYKCVVQRFRMFGTTTQDCSIAKSNEFAAAKKAMVSELFAKIRLAYPSTVFVDPQIVQCLGGTCMTQIDEFPIYSDLHHLNDFGSRALATRYLNIMGNPLTTPK